MVNQVLEALRKQSMLFADLLDSVRVPGHGDHPAIDALPLEEASICLLYTSPSPRDS